MEFRIARIDWRTHLEKGWEWATPDEGGRCTRPEIVPREQRVHRHLAKSCRSPLLERTDKALGNVVGLWSVTGNQNMNELLGADQRLKCRCPEMDSSVRDQKEQFRREQLFQRFNNSLRGHLRPSDEERQAQTLTGAVIGDDPDSDPDGDNRQ